MHNKRNPNPGEDGSLPARAEDSVQEKSETPRSYYYDDATGYEIYEEETDSDQDVEESDEEAL